MSEEKLIAKILEQTTLSRQELLDLVEEKKQTMNTHLSDEAILFILLKELTIKPHMAQSMLKSSIKKEMKSTKFKINKFLTLKLEGGKTNVYINDELFHQCRILLLNIPVSDVSRFDEIESIDEAAEKLDWSLEGPVMRNDRVSIPIEAEFWGHCSNLQVFYENNYDTRLLHSNLAFPLLKRLAEVGDTLAKKVLKEEVVKRLRNGTFNTFLFLFNLNYTTTLTQDEKELIYLTNNLILMESIEKILDLPEPKKHKEYVKILKILKELAKMGDKQAKEMFKEEIVKRLRSGDLDSFLFLFDLDFTTLLTQDEKESFYLTNNQILRESIENILSLPEQKTHKDYVNILKILRELAKMGDKYSQERLTDCLNEIQRRKPIPLNFNSFWDLIERTRNESNDDTNLQEKLLIKELMSYSYQDIIMFDEIFSFFTNKLRWNEGLARELVKNYDIFLSDDGWYYMCLGVVGLGKKLFTLALFEAPKFIKILKTGRFGHPRNIEHEFYAILYHVTDELFGTSELEDIDVLREGSESIMSKTRDDLEIWYLNMLRQKITEGDSETIAYLAINNFFDEFPKEELVGMLLDKKLHTIWIDGYFHFIDYADRYLSKLGTSISKIVREKITKSIQNNTLEDLLNYLGIGLFNNLTGEDLSRIFVNTNHKFLQILFKALSETEEYKYLNEEGLSLFYTYRDSRVNLLMEEIYIFIDSVEKGESKVDVKLFIQSRILEIIDDKKLIQLFENRKLRLLENIMKFADENYSEIGEWFYYRFLEQKGVLLSNSILQLVNSILKNQDLKLFKALMTSSLLEHMNEEDLTVIFADTAEKFYQILFKYCDTLSILEDYGNILPKRVIKAHADVILKSFSSILEKGNKNEFIQILRLSFFYGLDVKKLITSRFKEKTLEYVDFLMLLKDQYYEDIDIWFSDHIEECSKEGVLKEYLLAKINGDDQHGFLKFIKKNMLRYMEKRDIIDLFQDKRINFFEFLFQAIIDTKSYSIPSYQFDYPDFDEIKPIVQKIFEKYLVEEDLLKLTFLIDMRTINHFFRISEIEALFRSTHYDFLYILSKLNYYNNNIEELLIPDRSLKEAFNEEIDLILSKLERESPEFLKSCVLRVLSNPNKFTMFFITDYLLVKYIPPEDFIAVLEKDHDVLESFLEAILLYEKIFGDSKEILTEYLEPVVTTMSTSLQKKLGLFLE